jgi:hypothetical protein
MSTSQLSSLLPADSASTAFFDPGWSAGGSPPASVEEASENLLSYAEGGLDGKHPPSDAVAETLRGVVELYESLGEESVPMDELTERLRNSESEGLRRLAEMPELLRGLDAEGAGSAPNDVVSKEAVGSFIQKTDALLGGLPGAADAARRGLVEDSGGGQGAEPEASKESNLSHLLIEVGLGMALAAGAVATVLTGGAAAPLEAELGAVAAGALAADAAGEAAGAALLGGEIAAEAAGAAAAEGGAAAAGAAGEAVEGVVEEALLEAGAAAGADAVNALPQAEEIAQAAAEEIADAAGDAAGAAVEEALGEGAGVDEAVDAGLEAAQEAIQGAADEAAQADLEAIGNEFAEAMEAYNTALDAASPEQALAMEEALDQFLGQGMGYAQAMRGVVATLPEE